MERLCNKLNIVDCFVSIQGEGKYAGYPSIFIRVSGCNLRCCFKDSVCDTPYSSFKPEKGKWTKEDIIKILLEYPNIKDIVITGGEPMLYQDELADLLRYIYEQNNNTYAVTIETNGTIPVKPDNNFYVNLYSISPKLKTSVPVAGKAYVIPNSGEKIFTKEMCDELDKKRINYDAIFSMMDNADYQLKFVYSGDDSVAEIKDMVNYIKTHMASELPPENIMLMPEGITPEQCSDNGRKAVEVCMENGWTYTDRLHIRLWGDNRGF